MTELWIPSSARPYFHCRVCKRSFAERESKQFERHVVACAKANEAEIHDQGPQQQHPAWFKAWDPELEAWVQKARPEGGIFG